MFYFFQTESFKTTLGCERLLYHSPTPTRPIISTMQPPLTPWTEATTHRGATRVPRPQTALFPLRVQPVVKTPAAHRTTGYSTATSPWKRGTVQLVSLTVYRVVGISKSELEPVPLNTAFHAVCSILNYHSANKEQSNKMETILLRGKGLHLWWTWFSGKQEKSQVFRSSSNVSNPNSGSDWV